MSSGRDILFLTSGKKVNYVYFRNFGDALAPEINVVRASEKSILAADASDVVITKRFSGPDFVAKCKKRGHRLVYVGADVFSAPPRRFFEAFLAAQDLFDATFYPNRRALEHYARPGENALVLYEVSPQREQIKPVACGFEEPRLVFFGAKQNSPVRVPGLDPDLLAMIALVYDPTGFWAQTDRYNLHVNVRKGLDEVLFKSTPKILNAAYAGCPILTNRAHAEELFDADYPFFIEDNYTPARLRESFGDADKLAHAQANMSRIKQEHGFAEFRRNVRDVFGLAE